MTQGNPPKANRTAAAPARSRWALGLKVLVIVVFVTVVICMLFPSTRRRIPSPRTISWSLVVTVDRALKEYHSSVGSYPSGSLANIAETLQSPNETGLSYLTLDGIYRSPPGELLDGWKHPLRIILTNPAGPIVYSVGPNGRDDGGAPGSDDLIAP